MSLSVAEAIMQRRSIRSFKDGPLSDEQVTRLLRAARMAPSSLNSQPWRFKVLRSRADLEWLAGSPSRRQSWLATAGAVFLCCVDVDAYLESTKAVLNKLSDYASSEETIDGIRAYIRGEASAPPREVELAAAMNLALAVENMMLHAVELDLASCWVGMFERDALAARFGLAPSLRIISLLAVGEPAGTPGPQSRKPLEELVIS